VGSSPDDVIDFFFNLPNPFNLNVGLGFTQHLTETSTRRFVWGHNKTPCIFKSQDKTLVRNDQ
jgi:hypothetical protein